MSGYVDNIGRKIRRFHYRVSQTEIGNWLTGHWWWEASAVPEFTFNGEVSDGLSLDIGHGFARSQEKAERKAFDAITRYKRHHRAEDIIERTVVEVTA